MLNRFLDLMFGKVYRYKNEHILIHILCLIALGCYGFVFGYEAGTKGQFSEVALLVIQTIGTVSIMYSSLYLWYVMVHIPTLKKRAEYQKELDRLNRQLDEIREANKEYVELLKEQEKKHD